MKPVLFVQRNTYGQVVSASFDDGQLPTWSLTTRHPFTTSKQLAAALLQTGSRQKLIDAAWRTAVQQGAVEPSRPFKCGAPLDMLTIQHAQKEAAELDFYIGELVNNPNSQFYIHG